MYRLLEYKGIGVYRYRCTQVWLLDDTRLNIIQIYLTSYISFLKYFIVLINLTTITIQL